ncbi:Uncharacterised protein [Chryseobacterium nakagawai]|uniref:CD-NTase-associated protein 15 domain-containing protein n=1 Tax=Chryseobacterium nakagawai TaxID=1241982 RepID=A0AAD0YN76_CHRNA|nr:hypothetical protein [Chryseobacterium nakagawai]AZA92977.1 hypothetical protein EG343_21440 [Chryseobacterium nakagawai]VEH19604.1 Uncharacterised protein [Chryseobacterium nakagawai]
MNFKYYKTNNLIAFVAILTILLTLFYNQFEGLINSNDILKSISSYISIFSVLGLITLCLKLIDHEFWKYKISNLIINIPDLNGRYEGEMISSYNNIKLKCVMEITQTASTVHVCTYVGDYQNIQSSKSITICEELEKQKNGFYRLYYNYENESSQPNKGGHKGTAYLEFFPDIKTLKGKYFNDRSNTGAIEVNLKSKKLKGRFNV